MFKDIKHRIIFRFPIVYKSEQNIWLAEVWIAQELFEYLHDVKKYYEISIEKIKNLFQET